MKKDEKFEKVAFIVIFSGVAYFAAHAIAAIWTA